MGEWFESQLTHRHTVVRIGQITGFVPSTACGHDAQLIKTQ
jgi:hypothetical protein